MIRNAATCLVLSMSILAAAGCGGSDDAVTDVNKVTPLTEEQVKGFRAVDDAVAAEENANPTQPKRGGAGR